MNIAETNCPFCNLDRDVISENEHALAIRDNYPVSRGHSLIIPKLHVEDYFLLSPEVQNACTVLIREMKQRLQAEFQPDGFNVGINAGRAAGQTVPHAHIHLIPRFTGDVNEPRGGVRGVIPGKKEY